LARLFVSVGEASGDAYGAELLARIRKSDPDVDCEAVGGRRLAAAEAKLVADCSRWGALGIFEAIRVAPRVIQGFRRAKRALNQGDPGLFIPIDFGFMNVKLARHAKSKGWKVLYFIPPGSWRRNKQGSDLASVTDAIVTPFPWSAEMLNAMGANAHCFGHPLKEMISHRADMDRRLDQLAALPGSREHEIALNLRVIAQSAPDCVKDVEFAAAPTANVDSMRSLWTSIRPDLVPTVTSGDTYGVLARSRAAIICSGTATLEAALCRCPTVVIYTGSKMMELEYKIRKPKFDYVSLPNILLQRPVLPELLGQEATPERVRSALEAVWVEGDARQAQLDAFEELDALLGQADALTRTAELAVSMLKTL
jgi:lipid-A-disaccharide synthase